MLNTRIGFVENPDVNGEITAVKRNIIHVKFFNVHSIFYLFSSFSMNIVAAVASY